MPSILHTCQFKSPAVFCTKETILRCHHHGRSSVRVLAYGAGSGSSSTSNSVDACRRRTAMLLLQSNNKHKMCNCRPSLPHNIPLYLRARSTCVCNQCQASADQRPSSNPSYHNHSQGKWCKSMQSCRRLCNTVHCHTKV